MNKSGTVTTVSENTDIITSKQANASGIWKKAIRPLPFGLVNVASLVGVYFLARFISGNLANIEGIGTEISAGHIGFSAFFIALTISFIWLVRVRDLSVSTSFASVLRISGAVSFAAMLTALAAYLGLFGAVEGYDARSTVVVWGLSLPFIPAGELIARGCFSLVKRSSRYEIPVIVIGEPTVLADAAKQFQNNGHSYRMVGLVSPTDANVSGDVNAVVPTLGSIESLAQIVRAHKNGHGVLVAMPNHEYSHFKPAVESQPSSMDSVRVAMFPLNGAAEHKVFPRMYETVKRAMDLTIAIGALVVASPFMLTLAALIKLESHGPVFYSQVRVGRNGQFFKMHKFRSMRKDADKLLEELKAKNEAKGHMFKMAHDPRITRIGRIIRRLSIDELPQLFDVVAGTMSIIGPRPPLPHEVEEYGPRHFRRFEVVPGITGLWQVKRGSEIDFEEMIDLDIEYIDNWTIGMDVSILVKTIPAMLKGQGAM